MKERRLALLTAGALLMDTSCAVKEQTIDISSSALPSALPEAVTDIESAAVKVRIEGKKRYVQSGVKVGEQLVFSAGHGWRTKTKPDPGATCLNSTFIEGRHGETNTQTVNEKIVSVNDGQDLALIKTKGPLSDLATAPIASVRPQPGDPLYFINFQYTADERERGPLQPGILKSPAKFGGIVLGEEDGDIIAAPRKNYGMIPETTGHKAGSGGMVVTEDGVVGIYTDRYEKNYTANYLADRFNVTLTGVKKRTRLPIAVVEPVTPKTLRVFKKNLDIQPDPCMK